jgi:hypothetical protein
MRGFEPRPILIEKRAGVSVTSDEFHTVRHKDARRLAALGK